MRLLPSWAKRVGVVAVLLGLVLAVARFRFGVRPSVFDGRVFAVYSVFFETKVLSVISKNLTDEVIALLLLLGLGAIVWSRDAHETPRLAQLRLESWLAAVQLNGMLLGVAVLTLHGLGFVYALVANLYVLPLLFLVVFALRRRKEPTC